MKKKLFTLFSFLATGMISYAQVQEEQIDVKKELESMSAQIKELKEETAALSPLKGLKISGYVQAQWQIAQEKGMTAPFSGGNFPQNSDNRFMIRRGRLKVDYTYGIARGVLQIDATEKGVKIKDAYVALTTNSKVAGLTVGIFDRPFGYEISYSSSNRETPERSRLFQSLFPDERDMGAKITLQNISCFDKIRFEGGLFTGNGPNSENDSRKDFIGRLGYANTWNNFQLGVGTSAYIGGVYNTQQEGYTFDHVTKHYIKQEGMQGKYSQRNYYGVDVQMTLVSNIGFSQLRAEFIAGRQPGTANLNTSPKAEITQSIYNRKFMGYYIYFIQSIPSTKLSAVVRFDRFDPNRQIKGNEVGVAGSGTTAADLAYNTIGVGAVYQFNKALRVMAYYDMPKNEKTEHLSSDNTLANFAKDIKDNIFTLRLQCKF